MNATETFLHLLIELTGFLDENMCKPVVCNESFPPEVQGGHFYMYETSLQYKC